jgi:hypothetical protein
MFNLRKISINRTRTKTIQILVEMNNHIIWGLVDIGVSMFIIVANVVRKLRLIHLVVNLKSYKNNF